MLLFKTKKILINYYVKITIYQTNWTQFLQYLIE